MEIWGSMAGVRDATAYLRLIEHEQLKRLGWPCSKTSMSLLTYGFRGGDHPDPGGCVGGGEFDSPSKFLVNGSFVAQGYSSVVDAVDTCRAGSASTCVRVF